MAESKKPPRQARTSRNAPPRVSRPPKASDAASRLSACEAALAEARGAIAGLRDQVDSMRADLNDLRALLATRRTKLRLGPPPLPREMSAEVMLVDETDVTLESIRPKGLR
jgi:hypothetical protein